MLVLVGSKNPAKTRAVENAFKRYWKGTKARGIEVESRVAEQPLTMGETVQGAINRAKSAWKRGKCDYAVGIEAGLFKVKEANTGSMDVAAAAVFNGNRVSLGLSPAFEYPQKVVEKVRGEGKEVSDVFMEEWGENTRDEKGAIGRLSKGEVPRSRLQEMGVLMALLPFVNKKHYR